MLIHLSPKLQVAGFYVDAKLLDYSIAEIGIMLRGGTELAVRTPYPNKNYLVACRKVGQKAINGLFFETEQPVPEFTAVARWLVDGEQIVTHRVHYILDDQEFDAATDEMTMWHGLKGLDEEWESRMPACHAGATPVSRMVRMDLKPQNPAKPSRDGDFVDELSSDGDMIVQRQETFRIPTVQRDRLLGVWAKRDRFPDIAHAFKVIGR